MIQKGLIEDQKKRLGHIVSHCLLPGRDERFESYLTDRTKVPGRASAVVLPDSTEQVAEIVRFCRHEKIAIVPSGGRTGYAGGAVAQEKEQPTIVIAMDRMNRVLSKDPFLPAISVQAGVITKELQDAAEEMGFLFPIDFASSGSSQIGGNIATNAGGIHVIRYGMIRDWIVALTVVTGTGEILKLGGNLRKDNRGPDLKQAFIGSEGIFGIITEATLRLTPTPTSTSVALASLSSFNDVMKTLSWAQSKSLLAFECFDRNSLAHVRKHLDLPAFGPDSEWYALIEVQGLPETLHDAPELMLDLKVTDTPSRKKEFWKYRESISESISGSSLNKNDVSLPMESLESYILFLRETHAEFKDLDLVVFGHAGDGNLHVNWLKPSEMPEEVFSETTTRLVELNYDRIISLGGSISAEHGIGMLKRDAFLKYASDTHLKVIRSIKSVLDPYGIMNPGKVI